jgi:LytS/YehU family sensor histidine kinase
VLAIGFSAAWTGAIAGLSYAVDRAAAAAFVENGAAWQFIGGLIVYAAIAASARASVARRRLQERELAAANAELQALRARLDPHFLFNTLHSLTQLTREDAGAAAEALERFGGMMRYVLRAGDEAVREVALEDELGFVQQYLALERLRLGRRLNVEERVDPETLELAVPPLLLQPLVENAVRHGIAPRRSGGTVSIATRLEGERLALEVSDDGDGADAEAWRESAGLGLAAVRRLLEAHFPGNGELRIQTRPGAGFAVRLEMPARLPGGRP